MKEGKVSSNSRVVLEEERRDEHSRRLMPTEGEDGERLVVSLVWDNPKERRERLTVLSGSRLVRLDGDGKVDPDLSTLKVHSADVVDASLGILDGGHGDEPEASRSVGLKGRGRKNGKEVSELSPRSLPLLLPALVRSS